MLGQHNTKKHWHSHEHLRFSQNQHHRSRAARELALLHASVGTQGEKAQCCEAEGMAAAIGQPGAPPPLSTSRTCADNDLVQIFKNVPYTRTYTPQMSWLDEKPRKTPSFALFMPVLMS